MTDPAPEIVTAAILLIGDEILSGRTKDRNAGFAAEYLTALPPKALLQAKLHEAIALSRARLDNRSGEEA